MKCPKYPYIFFFFLFSLHFSFFFSFSFLLPSFLLLIQTASLHPSLSSLSGVRIRSYRRPLPPSISLSLSLSLSGGAGGWPRSQRGGAEGPAGRRRRPAAGRSRESSCPNRNCAPPRRQLPRLCLAPWPPPHRAVGGGSGPASTSSIAHPPGTKMENELLGRGQAGMSRYFWLLPGGEV